MFNLYCVLDVLVTCVSNCPADEDSTALSVGASVLKQAELLKIAPFVFPFLERVKFFTSLIVYDHSSSQGQQQEFLMGPSLHVKARRDHLYEDAFAELAQGAGGEGREGVGRDTGSMFINFAFDCFVHG